jgi:hypothetical protein
MAENVVMAAEMQHRPAFVFNFPKIGVLRAQIPPKTTVFGSTDVTSTPLTQVNQLPPDISGEKCSQEGISR